MIYGACVDSREHGKHRAVIYSRYIRSLSLDAIHNLPSWYLPRYSHFDAPVAYVPSQPSQRVREVLLLQRAWIVQSPPTTQIGQTRPQGGREGYVVGRRRA